MSKDLTKTQVVARRLGVVDAEAILKDIGRSFRRVEGSRAKDPVGLRCVWHQGKLRTEMLSWEKLDDKQIDRQEFTFFGKMVEYTRQNGLRTGVVADSAMTEAGPRIARSELFIASREPDVMMLDAAARILRECSKRDFYTQHLLAVIHEALAKLEKKAARTQVQGLDFFRSIEKAMAEETSRKASEKKLSLAAAAGIVAAAVIIAVLVFAFLWRGG